MQTSPFCSHIQRSALEDLVPYMSGKLPNGDWRFLLNHNTQTCPQRNAAARAGAPKMIFGLGLSRTGTDTLAKIIGDLGFTARHMFQDFHTISGEAPQDLWEALRESGNGTAPHSGFARALHRGLFTNLVGNPSTSRGVGFSDLPIPTYFAELYAAFPHGYFILTTRELESWHRSAAKLLNGGRPPNYDDLVISNRIAAYGQTALTRPHLTKMKFLAHYEAVLRTIPCCQLLLVDIPKNGLTMSWTIFCDFLGIEHPACNNVGLPLNHMRDSNMLAAARALEVNGTRTNTRH